MDGFGSDEDCLAACHTPACFKQGLRPATPTCGRICRVDYVNHSVVRVNRFNHNGVNQIPPKQRAEIHKDDGAGVSIIDLVQEGGKIGQPDRRCSKTETFGALGGKAGKCAVNVRLGAEVQFTFRNCDAKCCQSHAQTSRDA